jgi:hypothetical protein
MANRGIRLDPEGAAQRIAAYLATRKNIDAMVVAIARNYDGLKLFDDELSKAGVKRPDLDKILTAETA